VLRGDVTAGLRLVLNEAKGVPARFVFVKPATAARDDERRVSSLPSPQQGPWVKWSTSKASVFMCGADGDKCLRIVIGSMGGDSRAD
jgi:hypothetical protein